MLPSLPTSWRVHSTMGPVAALPSHATFCDDELGLHFHWTARAHRKQSLVAVTPSDHAEGKQDWRVVRKSIRWIAFDYSDLSWWISMLFTVGSIFWCVNGSLFYIRFDASSLADYANTEAAFAFLGGTFFIVGAYLGWVESLNTKTEIETDWKIDTEARTITEPDRPAGALERLSKVIHREKSSEKSSSSSNTTLDPPPPPRARKLRWFGTHRSLGYLANTVQLFGATIFFLSVLVGLPGVLPLSGASGGPSQSAASEGLWIGLYWAPQVIGAPCFVFAGAIFCLEQQHKWWKPRVWNLGWQIGFWNLVGGFGFFWCGVFGILRQSSIGNPELYQRGGTALSTFWGSWAFLFGSYLQLLEGINNW